MLSKLRFLQTKEGNTPPLCGDHLVELQLFFGDNLSAVQSISGGTLGLCYIGNVKGTQRFFKTHRIQEGKPPLVREYQVLRELYGSICSPELIQFSNSASGARAWLCMDRLEASRSLTASEIASLVSDFEIKIAELSGSVPLTNEDNFSFLLNQADESLAFLAHSGLISPAIVRKIDSAITLCRNSLDPSRFRLCHGDLGPANIMRKGCIDVVIDWEDLFMGPVGYDYLYWLTFFSNRKWLVPESLGKMQNTPSVEVSVMMVILLLKSHLSVMNGSYNNNNLTFDERISEVINLV